MVKTRRGAKRVSPKLPENEPPDVEEKKQKIDRETKSKYFDKETTSSVDKQSASFEDNKSNSLRSSDNVPSDSNDSVGHKKSKHLLKIEKDAGSDDSSSDEFLKVPFSLDDLGHFETLKKEPLNASKENETASSSTLPNLSNDSDNEQETKEQEFYDFSQIIQSQQLLVNTKKEQEEKASCEKQTLALCSGKKKKLSRKVQKKPKTEQKYDIKSVGEELGISELLAMGEGSRMDIKVESESSEEENDNEVIKSEETYSAPKEGIEVVIELPNMKQKKKSKGFDIEAAMKRRINLIKKENQVFMHKVHTLCWIAHGIFLNRTINNNDLMGLALSLIPSKHCYPPKHADLSYLEKLVEWFVGKIVVDKNHKLAQNSSKSPLLNVLETQIDCKVAFSLRDLVLIFVCMVRSLGINARLIVSLRPVPLRPPASDLAVISNKPKVEKSINNSKTKKSVTSSKINKETTKVTKVKYNLKSKSNKKNMSENSQSEIILDKTPTTNNVVKMQKKKIETVIKNKRSEIKSSYFSSSDEVPLTELASRSQSNKLPSNSKRDVSSNQSSPIKNGRLNKFSAKQQNEIVSRACNTKSRRNNQEKIVSIEVSRKNKIKDTSNVASPYFDITNNKSLEKNESVVKTRNRRSVASTYREPGSSSSEDEVEIPKRTPKVKKDTKSVKKTTGSNQKKCVPSNKEEYNDSDFKPKASTSRQKSIDRRVLSSDDETSNSPKKIGSDFWAEVFLEAEEKWISVDLRKGKVHCIQQLYSGATQPVRYVVAWNNDGTLKDVTRRYAPHWLTVTRKQRAEDSWWKETVTPYLPDKSHREKEEDEDLDRQMYDKPLPTSVSEYKNHPLYALRRHLLKFEAIYPPDAPPLGFVKGEPVYSRGCVADLHTRETWIKEAKLVRKGEEPYKIVKARPKWDKLSQTVINDLPLPLFGHWQVEDYIPPPAVDGKVPRNEYGNVELYKPCMLPPGTVHLQVPQLARVARKLGIDCAPAVVGWEFSGGGSHPVLDGFIVCEELRDVLLDAWNKEIDESAKRAKEKVEQRVYGNWKRIIRGLLIRERLKVRYDFGVPTPVNKKKKQNSRPSTSKS